MQGEENANENVFFMYQTTIFLVYLIKRPRSSPLDLDRTLLALAYMYRYQWAIQMILFCKMSIFERLALVECNRETLTDLFKRFLYHLHASALSYWIQLKRESDRCFLSLFFRVKQTQTRIYSLRRFTAVYSINRQIYVLTSTEQKLTLRQLKCWGKIFNFQ